jgi:hypothetical protein
LYKKRKPYITDKKWHFRSLKRRKAFILRRLAALIAETES